jgi:hypothetical protein
MSQTSIDTLYKIDLTNWYDSADDAYQKLGLKVFAVKTSRVGQNIITQQYTLTEQLNTSTIYVRLPPFAVDWPLIYRMYENDIPVTDSMFLSNISLCVQAQDPHNAINQKCSNLGRIMTKKEFTYDYAQVVNFIKTLNMTHNLTNVIFGSNVLHQSI